MRRTRKIESIKNTIEFNTENNQYEATNILIDNDKKDFFDLPDIESIDDIPDNIKDEIYGEVFGDCIDDDIEEEIKPVKKKVVKKMIVQNSTKKTVTETPKKKTEITLAKWPVKKKVKKVVKKSVKKKVKKVAVKKPMKRGIKISKLKTLDIDTLLKYNLPKSLETSDFPKGKYTVVKMNTGAVKVFDPKQYEVTAKTFMVHTIPDIENWEPKGASDLEIKNLRSAHTTRTLGLRFVNSLKNS